MALGLELFVVAPDCLVLGAVGFIAFILTKCWGLIVLCCSGLLLGLVLGLIGGVCS